ncbi:MAG: hypothetical protein ACYCUI_11725 [Vulcanimicrobiaceae bacterium]
MGEPFWVACSAIGSGLAALATAVLAFLTYWLARSTRLLAESARAAMQAEERRHADSLQPHVAVFIETDDAGSAVILQNIGPGYAKDIILHGVLIEAEKIRVLNVPPPLASKQRCKYILCLGTPSVIWEGFSVSYKDAFDNEFVTTTGSGRLTFTNASNYMYQRVQMAT